MSRMRYGLNVGILTVSDTCFTKDKEDTSGPNLEKLLTSGKLNFRVEVIKSCCVPDQSSDIQSMLKQWADDEKLDLILTVGGTGFSSRDVTPEATKAVIEREAPAVASAMLLGCQKKTSLSILSRSTCGIRGRTLILNLPGSVKGSQECLEQVVDIIPHAIDQLRGRTAEVARTHQHIQGTGTGCSYQKSCVDVTRIADRPRKSTFPMISVREALEMVLKQTDVVGTEYKKFTDSLGYVLAVRVVAEEHLPPFPASIKDGYAVIAADGRGIRRVLGSMPAGAHPLERHVEPGTCIRVSTGGAIPSGADTVVQVEDTELVKKNREGTVELEINILKTPSPGQDIRPVGSDIRKNQVMIPLNKLVTSAEIGLMAAAGISQVLVYKKPEIALLSSGNELVEPGESLKPGCIWDSNKVSLLTLLKEHNFSAFDVGIARDTPEELRLCFESAFSRSDVIISTGGVSMGEKDIIKQVLEMDFGAKIHFARVFMKPGKPTTFATLEHRGKKKFIFGLPGNPVSAMVTFHLYVIPCLRKMMGYSNPKHITIKAKLMDEIELDLRPEYHRASLCWAPDSLCPVAYSTGNQMSSRQLSMLSADALLTLPPRNEHQSKLFAGALIDAILLKWI